MTGSDLVVHVKQSPNHYWGRAGQRIWILTPHCVVGQCTAESLGELFARPARRASSTYGIDKDGRIAQYVDEANAPWTTSSYWNDCRAITVEVASDTYDSLVRLGADICRRYGFKRVIYAGNLWTLQNTAWPADALILSCHRWFAATACPGDWLLQREEQLAKDITSEIEEGRDLTKEETITLIEERTPTIVNRILDELARQRRTDNEMPKWAGVEDEFDAAHEHGITDKTRPNDFPTRLESAIMANRARDNAVKAAVETVKAMFLTDADSDVQATG